MWTSQDYCTFRILLIHFYVHLYLLRVTCVSLYTVQTLAVPGLIILTGNIIQNILSLEHMENYAQVATMSLWHKEIDIMTSLTILFLSGLASKLIGSWELMVQSGQKSKIVEETLYIVDASVYGKSLVSHGKLQRHSVTIWVQMSEDKECFHHFSKRAPLVPGEGAAGRTVSVPIRFCAYGFSACMWRSIRKYRVKMFSVSHYFKPCVPFIRGI